MNLKYHSIGTPKPKDYRISKNLLALYIVTPTCENFKFEANECS